MHEREDAWLQSPQSRYLRPDFERYLRPDRERYLKPRVQDDPPRHVRYAPATIAREIEEVREQRAMLADIPREKQELAALKVKLAFLRNVRSLFKARSPSDFDPRRSHYDPNQPRVPKGNPDGGQWTDTGGGGREGWVQVAQVGGPPGIGHNSGEPPEIPENRPSSSSERTNHIRAIGEWLIKYGGGLGSVAYFGTLNNIGWLKGYRDNINAFRQPPKTLEELQQDAFEPKPGYQIHHIVEQTGARNAGFLNEKINARDNLVRISTIRHYDVTAWYGRRNAGFGGLSPREYLQDKSWETRRRVGLHALRRFEIMR